MLSLRQLLSIPSGRVHGGERLMLCDVCNAIFSLVMVFVSVTFAISALSLTNGGEKDWINGNGEFGEQKRNPL